MPTDPQAYVGTFARDVALLATLLTEDGRPDEAVRVFSSADDLVPARLRPQLAYARGLWHAHEGRIAQAIIDLRTAVAGAADVGDRFTRGQARLSLRLLRSRDEETFDAAWDASPLPLWLEHEISDAVLAAKIIEWVQAPDWAASRAMLEAEIDELATDRGEATVEHLIDDNPVSDVLVLHLTLIRDCRHHGVESAYDRLADALRNAEAAEALQLWLVTPTWSDSLTFAAEHHEVLASDRVATILGAAIDAEPADALLRAHLGLLWLLRADGIDAAYALRADPVALADAVAAEVPAGVTERLVALLRIRSDVEDDDPDAHFQLAAAALASGAHGEAAAAMSDCAVNAAPFERLDFQRRLERLALDHPELDVTELLSILARPPTAQDLPASRGDEGADDL